MTEPRIPTIQYVPGEKSGPEFCEAFAQGCGGKVSLTYEGGPLAMYGSPRLWESVHRAQAEGAPWAYGDKGYFGRGGYHRITMNALQHTGIGEENYGRAIRVGVPRPRPWNRHGRDILLCPQSADFMSRFGMTQKSWIDDMTERLRKHTDRPIRVRNKFSAVPLERDLMKSYAVVVYTSNCAVDAVMAGIPAIATGKCAASLMTCNKPEDINNLLYPTVEERFAWASVLASNQWTIQEIKRGEAWEVLRDSFR